MKVGAGADEEEHDQEEGLELEDAEHCECVPSRYVRTENDVSVSL